MQSSSKVLVGTVVVVVLLVLVAKPRLATIPPGCAGPPLRTAVARQKALEQGFAIDPQHDCIDKQSYDQVTAANKLVDGMMREATASAHAAGAIPDSGETLAKARQGFTTRYAVPAGISHPLPHPPANLFVRTDFASAGGLVLTAFVTPDPRDGKKHPAIIWLTGGDSNTLDDFWTPGPESNDQSVSAFRNAGLMVMFPTLRGGNTNPGGKEFFLGEVDDVLAAADHLAQLGYVDADRIYLGGHSTGGTLALLTSETSGRFNAVFAFGPVSVSDHYPASLVPEMSGEGANRERMLRSPIHWLSGITSPTYLIEGASSANSEDVRNMCGVSKNPQLHCIVAAGSDHFSVLSRVTHVIAARLALANEIDFALRPEEFASAP
jgi:acetyl esterase/lipase